MSELFAKYPELPEVASETTTTAEKSVWEKKFNKRLKRQNKLLKRLAELHKQQEQPTVEDTNTKKNSFLNKVGDAFAKALPTILITIVTASIGSYFGTRPHRAYDRGR